MRPTDCLRPLDRGTSGTRVCGWEPHHTLHHHHADDIALPRCGGHGGARPRLQGVYQARIDRECTASHMRVHAVLFG
jgi:hypothetical protein